MPWRSHQRLRIAVVTSTSCFVRKPVYVLGIQDRKRRHVRAKPQPFTMVSNQTVHMDIAVGTGVR